MRILMLTQWFQPEAFFKGLPLAKNLRDRGHEVEVLTGFPNYPEGLIYDGYRMRLWQCEVLDGIRVNRVALFPSHDRSGMRCMLNYLSFATTASLLGPWLVRKPDVIYVYNLITLGMAARMIRLFRGCKVVLDVQDLWPESVASSGMMGNRFLLALLKRWCRAEYVRCDRLVVLSPGFKENLVARGIDEQRIDVVYNWCDETAMTIPEPDPTVAAELGFTNRFNVVFAGTMGVMQALDCVIECARRLETRDPEVQFTFVGGGIDVDRLKRLAADLKNVQFLARQPRSEIGRVLANADALLVHLKDDPLFEITIPSKIQAYLHAGKPVLCGVRGDAAELVCRSGAGKAFQPENPDSLADAILELRAKSPAEFQEMGRAGYDFYDQHLSFEKGVDRIEQILRGVTAG